ncbi:hypothetical protein D081_2399 [Anaerovibrio sp. JC8]|nr:hypothetical protein D081_2399 [Anaerovibrio sp. JC8]
MLPAIPFIVHFPAVTVEQEVRLGGCSYVVEVVKIHDISV